MDSVLPSLAATCSGVPPGRWPWSNQWRRRWGSFPSSSASTTAVSQPFQTLVSSSSSISGTPLAEKGRTFLIAGRNNDPSFDFLEGPPLLLRGGPTVPLAVALTQPPPAAFVALQIA